MTEERKPLSEMSLNQLVSRLKKLLNMWQPGQCDLLELYELQDEIIRTMRELERAMG